MGFRMFQGLESVLGIKGSPNGFIYVSFGTVLSPNTMSNDTRNKFTRVFSRLKQTIIWKAEPGQMEDIPNNVVLRKWLPQQDLLGTESFMYCIYVHT